MKHLLHRIPMSRKFALALALPLLVIAWLAGTGIVERQQLAANMAEVERMTDLATQMGDLIHELQVERGMSVGYLTSDGEAFAGELGDQHDAVDRRVAAFRSRQAELALEEDGIVADRLAAAETQLAALDGLRGRIDGLQADREAVIETFNTLIDDLLVAVGRMSSLTDQGAVSRRLAAYYALMEMKETAGIERAVLTGAFGQDGMSSAVYRQFVLLLGEESAFQESFYSLATRELRERLEAAMDHQEASQLGMMRQIALTRGIEGGYSIGAQRWFDMQTRKIERLKEVEDAMAADIRERVAGLATQARGALLLYALLAGLAALVAIVLSVLIVRSIVGPLREALDDIQSRGGDLTRRLAVPGSDELSRLYAAFNDSTASMETLVASIQQGAQGVGSASGEIAQGNEDLASRTEEQSSSLVETATSMEQMTATVRQSADSAREAHDKTEQAAERSEQASRVAGEARDAMQAIFEANRQVTAIVEAIDGIAFQTNLLALNASVEAARAGEHGRGFAVVAGEVRLLASRSAEEAERIRRLIADNAKRVKTGDGLVTQTHDALSEIAREVRQVADLVADMSAATTEQSAGIEQINQAVSQLEETTQQNAALVEQVAAASRSLDGQAGEMGQLIARFKVGEAQERREDIGLLPQPG
ncbi:HAMP domain-containing protein [Halomonas campisalis]|uniref:HAMP domain-containing protein n=1 Tax=Billgrantia campisalis TaxID=74661 RepID=A0ABS9P8Q6_9GAMM|nr:methyl-accepting chemotaxis protein [Halomonas campisalis]MCG6658159.1 HAMP domain-containing protein [Halomonas campisalis]MDR5862828.1 nitrate- and nitrite sensing domain-containing protein [Halomonas campisalis]